MFLKSLVSARRSFVNDAGYLSTNEATANQVTIPLGTVTVMFRRLVAASIPRRAAQPSCSCIHEGRPAGMSASGIAGRSFGPQVSPYGTNTVATSGCFTEG